MIHLQDAKQKLYLKITPNLTFLCNNYTVSSGMGNCLHTGKPPQYVTSHPGQLSLAIHPRICVLSTSESWVTVTVTEALVLRPLLEDRGRITESICILVPVDRMKQKCFLLAVQQQKRLCRRFVDVSVARRGCHVMKHTV